MADLVDIKEKVAAAGNWTESADLLIEGIESGSEEDRAYAEGLLRTLCALVDNFGLGGAHMNGAR